MNERTANQIEEMKKQTIGVEVEMNSITRERAAKIAAKFFWNRTIRIHSQPKRLSNLVSLGRTGKRMEIPERRKHRRTGQ